MKPVKKAPQISNHGKPAVPAKRAAKEPSKLVEHLVNNASRFGPKKLFILDTNVLMHDPMSLFRFEEHDVYIPMMVLEELDNNKKGVSEVARNARQASRTLDSIVSGCEHLSMQEGIELSVQSKGQATGRLFFQTEAINGALPATLPTAKADNQIIGVALHLKEKFPKREVILVSKDINMRVKARALEQSSQDYLSDQVLEDADLLYAGTRELSSDFWETHVNNVETSKKDNCTFYRIRGPLCSKLLVNEFVWQDGANPFRAIVHEHAGKSATLRTFPDYTHPKNNVWGIRARNREQGFALDLLMNPDIDLVFLSGQAGTGKTLMTLAAALEQTLVKKLFTEIIFTRATISVGEDIGFLPGTEEEKMSAWMGAMEDNLEVLGTNDAHNGQREGESKRPNDWGRAATSDLIRSRLKIKSMNFMRGRTFINKFLIIDETQNLTPKQMKTLITRAGPGTKVVCLGNIAQIDTPYLTEGGSGLTYAVDRFKDWQHSGHITLLRGERSRLADYAVEVL